MKQSALLESFTESQTKNRRLWFAVLFGSLTAFGPLSIDMYLPALPALTTEFHASASVVQLSITAFLVGLAAGQLVVGPLSDSRGRKQPLIIGLTIFVISSLLCIVMPSVWGLIIMRFVQGASAAASIVISRASARDLFSGTELTKFFAMLMLVNGVAPIAAPIIGGQLLIFMNWQGVFAVLAGFGLLMITAVSFSLPETLPKNKRSAGGLINTVKTFKVLITDKVFIGYCFAQGFVYAAMFAYIAGSPFLLQEHFNLSPQIFGLCFAVNGAGIIAASQLTGRLAGKINERTLLNSGLIIALCGSGFVLFMLLIDAGLIPVLVPLFFAISSVGIVGTSSFALAMGDKEKVAGSAAAMLGLMPHMLGAAAAPLAGIGDSTLPMAIVMVACHIIALLAYRLLCKQNEKIRKI